MPGDGICTSATAEPHRNPLIRGRVLATDINASELRTAAAAPRSKKERCRGH